MGALELSELFDERKPYISAVKPPAFEEGVILGRVTDSVFDSSTFEGSTILINLSNSDIHAAGLERKLVRKKTTGLDIIRSVIKVSHADVYTNHKITIVNTVDKMYKAFETSGIDLKDRDITSSIEERYEKLKKTDLLRAIRALEDAEYDQHQGIYSETIINPARLMATWMIAHENTIEHV